jgi:hypothetical protein
MGLTPDETPSPSPEPANGTRDGHEGMVAKAMDGDLNATICRIQAAGIEVTSQAVELTLSILTDLLGGTRDLSSEPVSVSGLVFRLNEEGQPWQLRPEISSS